MCVRACWRVLYVCVCVAFGLRVWYLCTCLGKCCCARACGGAFSWRVGVMREHDGSAWSVSGIRMRGVCVRANV